MARLIKEMVPQDRWVNDCKFCGQEFKACGEDDDDDICHVCYFKREAETTKWHMMWLLGAKVVGVEPDTDMGVVVLCTSEGVRVELQLTNWRAIYDIEEQCNGCQFNNPNPAFGKEPCYMSEDQIADCQLHTGRHK